MKNTDKTPAHLSRTAKAWWKKLNAEWVLDDAGRLILQSGLEAFDRMVEAQAIISEHGLVKPDRFGQLKTNPAVLVERDCRAGMLSAFRQLHLDLEPLNDKPGRPAGK